MRDLLFHYNISINQLHLNGWVLLKAFEEYFVMIGLESSEKIFRNYYTLNGCPQGDHDVCWLFTFSSWPKSSMKNILEGKTTHVKGGMGDG
jgi:hypothetical protein